MTVPASSSVQGPLLSIVVLVYNTGRYLRECFDSLLAQEYRHIEIIAIDDASTDDSLAICREYEAAHRNFRCISKPNEGGAVSGNLGVALARGEYVALVDSDDVVTPSGYRLLMEQMLGHDADIAIGRAARLTPTGISAVAFLYEPYVWSRRQVFDSVEQFPDVIHDCFYWNKVFRTAFLREHALGMVPGLLYADRPFVHRAYWHSRRTAIIPDLVYLWRSRDGDAEKSISQNVRQAANFIDRIRSMVIEWHDFDGIAGAGQYRREIAVANLQRALFAAPGIVGSPSLRQAFIASMQELIALYGDLDWRSLGARRCLYLELIRRGEVEALCFLLGVSADRGWIAEIDGACYWKQPFLDNPEVPVPREVMRLDFPNVGFFQVHDLAVQGSRLALTLHLHDTVMARCEVAFELHSIHGAGSIPFQATGQVDRHRWRYELDLDGIDLAADALHGVVMHYTTADGIRGRYRIGQSMLPGTLQSRLPLAAAHGRLQLSAAAGGLALTAS
ncbi:MAG: glycosyltransferase [Pseudoxanthomonas sp.]|nr:glycosyltransferase [Pseudoxanthomonas sp.]